MKLAVAEQVALALCHALKKVARAFYWCETIYLAANNLAFIALLKAHFIQGP
jgi:hypothetical protein